MLITLCLVALQVHAKSTMMDVLDSPIYVYNNTIYKSNKQFRASFPIDNETLTVALIPCYGMFDWFIGFGFAPNRTDYSLANLFTKDGNAYTSATFPYNETTTAYVYVEAKDENDEGDIAAVFDIIAWKDDPLEAGIVPQPAKDGKISGSYTNDNKDGTLKWTGTGNDKDSYEIYYNQGHGTEGGYFPFTACGAKRWMQPFTSDQGDIKKNNDGTYEASIKDIPRKDPYSLTVLVSREDGYAASYTTFVFNASPVLKSSLALFSAAIMFLICIF